MVKSTHLHCWRTTCLAYCDVFAPMMYYSYVFSNLSTEGYSFSFPLLRHFPFQSPQKFQKCCHFPASVSVSPKWACMSMHVPKSRHPALSKHACSPKVMHDSFHAWTLLVPHVVQSPQWKHACIIACACLMHEFHLAEFTFCATSYMCPCGF